MIRRVIGELALVKLAARIFRTIFPTAEFPDELFLWYLKLDRTIHFDSI
jgi:hypothetical protein